MMKSRQTPAHNLRVNMLHLMALHGDDTVSLSVKSGIPQRTVYNLIHTEQRASVEQAEQLASAYGYTGWQIIMPGLLPSPKVFAMLIEGYMNADDTDRALIDAIVNRPRR